MTIGRKIGMGFGTLLGLVATLAVVVLICLDSIHRQFTFVIEHEEPVIANARHLLRLVVDMESGQRGFVITGKQEFLEPYDNAHREFMDLVKYEKELVRDNPSRVGQLEKIEADVREWQSKAAQPEIAMRKKILEAKIDDRHLQELLGDGVGKAILDQIRVVADEMERHFRVDGNLNGVLLIKSIQKCMVDQETGERGFLITGKDDFLEPYELGQSELKKAFTELRSLISNAHDRAATVSDLAELGQYHARWIAEAAEPGIRLRRRVTAGEKTRKDLTVALKASPGKSLLDEMQTVLDRMSTRFVNSKNERLQALIVTVERAIADQEIGQHRFLITGKDEFLQHHKSGRERWKAGMLSLRNLNAKAYHVPTMERNVAQLERLAEKWLSEAAVPEIAARRLMNKHPESLQDVAKMLEAGTGKKILDRIRAEFGLILEEEEVLMAERFTTASLAARATTHTIFALIFVSLIFGGTIALKITSGITKPVRNLSSALEMVAKGDLDQEIETISNDEIGELSLSFNRMVSDLKQMEANREWASEKMKNSETRLQTIFETAGEGILTIDTHGIVTSCNLAASEMFGYPTAELIGQNISVLTPSPHREQHDQYLAKYLRTGQAKVVGIKREVEGRRKDGTMFPLALAVSEVKTNGMHLFTGIVRDLSEQYQLQSELAQAQKLESVGQLAAGIAHEINTPTQYVGDNARFLKEAFDDIGTVLDSFEKLLQAAKEGPVDEQLVADVEAGLEQADVAYLREEIPQAIGQSLHGIDRVAKIVHAMKEFSHPGGEEKSLVNLSETIETTMTVAHNEWKYVAEVVTEFDSELPEVSCHPGELNQVFLNLIVNAAHAIGDTLGEGGTEKGTITVGTRRDGDWAEIFIRDTGTGIPEEVRTRIFDPFFTTKGVGKGTGQGLAIVRSVIVDKHSGTIDCQSELGQGTTFVVRLPISGTAQEEEANHHEDACFIRG